MDQCRKLVLGKANNASSIVSVSILIRAECVHSMMSKIVIMT